jgi:hypothetical protein
MASWFAAKVCGFALMASSKASPSVSVKFIFQLAAAICFLMIAYFIS